ncbi:hypothetical protein BC830DRAFT_148113 [Chytriomyces sp. MP71]|nr:hypothetical protein BC830DRAFT_148113 [Chytriomyces sp. MP71]
MRQRSPQASLTYRVSLFGLFLTNQLAARHAKDNFHPTHPSHLFLYVTPNGREHPSQRVLFFSAHHLAFVALRASMSVMYSAGSKENVLRVVNVSQLAWMNIGNTVICDCWRNECGSHSVFRVE